MPNYEPTPRRFSNLSVSRSASRRNSIDDSARPNLLHDLLSLQNPPPLDLTNALRHLQHVDTDGEIERGRTRHARGDKPIRSTWGHDATVTAPAAKRESSASTRERIAVWEERSRSKSRGDVGQRHRISVVPEVPELSAAFEVFEEEEKRESLANQGLPMESQEPHAGDVADGDVERVREAKTAREESDVLLEVQTQMDEPEHLQGLTHTPQGSSPASSRSPDPTPDTPKLEKTFEMAHERPQTPIHQTRERPPTPDTMPRPPLLVPHEVNPWMLSNAELEQADREGIFDGHINPTLNPRTPPTPPPGPDLNRAQDLELPLTPQATPEQHRRRPHNEEEGCESFPGGQSFHSSPRKRYSAMFQPGDHDHQPSQGSEITTQSPAQYHLPSGLLWDEPSREEQRRATRLTTPEPPRPSNLPVKLNQPAQHEEPRYHNVWRISSYQPDFPLPSRRPDPANIESLELIRFDGNPLQALPRGQLPSEPRNQHAAGIPPYPYARPVHGEGDWVVNIPPSPNAAYFQGEQVTRAPRTRSRSRVRAERYISGNDSRRHEWDAPPVIERALHAASVSMIQGLNVPVEVYRGLRDAYYPAPGRPDIIKAYPIRRRLPVR